MTHVSVRLLEEAATWLEQHAWVQGVYGRSDNKDWDPDAGGTPESCCALGVLAYVGSFRTGDEGWIWTALMLAQWLGLDLDEDPDYSFSNDEIWEPVLEYVANWNDAPERTREEVVAALRAAARYA